MHVGAGAAGPLLPARVHWRFRLWLCCFLPVPVPSFPQAIAAEARALFNELRCARASLHFPLPIAGCRDSSWPLTFLCSTAQEAVKKEKDALFEQINALKAAGPSAAGPKVLACL